MNTLRILASFAFLGVLQAPVHAQFPERPQIAPSQTMSPDRSEWAPTPGSIRSLLFGDQVTRHDNIALVWEPEFPLSGARKGRVAVFTRNSQRIWARSASLEPPSKDPAGFGPQMAIFNHFALIKTSERTFISSSRASGS